MPTPKPTNSIPPATLSLYEKLVATIPNLERKGATVPYTPVIGHMFSYLIPGGILALRLPQQVREDYLKKYKTALFILPPAASSFISRPHIGHPSSLRRPPLLS